MSSPISSVWSSTVQRLLTPALDSKDTEIDAKVSNQLQKHRLARSSTYPSGSIWRSFVAKCIYQDLKLSPNYPQVDPGSINLEDKLDDGKQLTGHPEVCAGRQQERRFVRMNELGLGGLIMYEIPHSVEDAGRWTVDGVFGDVEDPEKRGMTIEELLDGIQVKLVYIPLYACTSFVTGQIMNAVFHNSDDKDMRPIPVTPGACGFSVNSQAFALFDQGIPLDRAPEMTPSKPALDILGFLRRAQVQAPRFRKDVEAFASHQGAKDIEQYLTSSCDIPDDQWELDQVEDELTATSDSDDDDSLGKSPQGPPFIFVPSFPQSSLSRPSTSLSKYLYNVDTDVLPSDPSLPSLHSFISSATISSGAETECTTDLSMCTSNSCSSSSGLSDALSEFRTPSTADTDAVSFPLLCFDPRSDVGLYTETDRKLTDSRKDLLQLFPVPGSNIEIETGMKKALSESGSELRKALVGQVPEMCRGKENIPPSNSFC